MVLRHLDYLSSTFLLSESLQQISARSNRQILNSKVIRALKTRSMKNRNAIFFSIIFGLNIYQRYRLGIE